MDVRVVQFDKICRVCLNECTDMKSLLSKIQGEERTLRDLLAFTAHIHVKLEDTLPKQVCNECEYLMCKADAFKSRCLKSDAILNKLYLNANNRTDPTDVNTKCLIKDENCHSKPFSGKFDPYQPSNSSKCGYQDDFDKKNIIFPESMIFPTTDPISNKLSGSEMPDHSKQVVKVEIMYNNDDHNDFSDHFDTEVPIEPLPITYNEATVKLESETCTCCCGKQFNSKDKLNAHTKEMNCNKYKKVFEKLNNKIVNIIPIKNNLHCPLCDCKLKSPSAWKNHQQRHRRENAKKKPLLHLYQCSLCLSNFKSKSSLSKHIQKHEQSDGAKHICEICKREFKYKAYLENHVLSTHHRNNSITCNVCAKSFISQEALQTHEKCHQSGREHECKVCNKIFYMSSTLKEHMRTHTGEKPYLCSQCGRGFSQKNNLVQHTWRHQGLKPFKCEECEKRFVSKGELDAHTRKHSGAHPFICDECGNGFTTSSSLVKHRRTHNGERPYRCDLCPMRFAASGTLKNHRRTHTGERPFQCSYCEKAFVQKNDLVSHIRCHTGERPYVCTQCGQAFRKASGLKTHVKMHGKELSSDNMAVLQGVNAILNAQCNEQ